MLAWLLVLAIADGAPVFAPPVTLPAATGPYQVVTGDFNGDPFPDFAVVNSGAWNSGAGGNSVSVYPGNGDGTFQNREDYTTGAFPTGIATGDLNGDGAADLVVVNRRPAGGNSWLSVFLNKNDGTGDFFPEQQVPSGAQPMHAAIGRFDADEHPDIAVAVHGNNRIQILIGNGDGTFTEPNPRIPVGTGPTGILVADINRDGKADVAVTNWFNANISILLGNGDGTFAEAPARPATGNRCWNLAAGDFNDDGNPDIAAPSSLDSTMCVLLGNGDGSFQPQSAFATGAGCYDIAIADIDQDGSQDLVTASTGVRFFMGHGDGTFTIPPQIVPSTADANPSPAVADFNGDSAWDLVATNTSANSVSVILQSPPEPGPRGTSFAIYPPVATPPQTGSYQGTGVAIDGNLAAVGVPNENSNAGAVRVYDADNGRVLHHIPNPDTVSMGDFGSAISLSGNRLVVGALLTEAAGLTHAGKVHVFNLAGASPATPVLTVNHPTPQMAGHFGSAVAISGALVMAGSPNTESVLVYNLDGETPSIPSTVLTNPDAAFGDFGMALAASGNRLVVGAANAAWVYEFGASTGVLRLDNPTPAAGDLFGCSVAISGNRVVVGDRGDDTKAADAGCVHVYDLSGATPGTAVATLFKPNAAASEFFGFAVAASAAKVVVATPYADTWGDNAGGAWVFDVGTGPVLTIHNPEPSGQDGFGWSAAIAGTRIVVGMPAGDSGGVDTGCAYAYDLLRLNSTAPVAALNKGAPPTGGHFGQAVAVTGTRVIIGSPEDDTGAENAGCVFVHDLSGVTPTLNVLAIPNPSPEANDHFGRSVAASGNHVVVGVPDDDAGADNAGAVRVFNLASGTPGTPVLTLINPSPAAEDRFGSAVAMDGNRIVVGASQDDTGGNDMGSAYVFDITSANPEVPVFILIDPESGMGSGNRFGEAVGVSGDHVVIGAPNAGGDESGTVYHYDLAGATPTVPSITLQNPDAIPMGHFGCAVAVSSRFAVVGQNGGFDGGAGVAYVHDLASWDVGTAIRTIMNPSASVAVAIHGNRIVVGSSFEGVEAGEWIGSMVSVFDLSGEPGDTQLNLVASFMNPRPLAVDLGAPPPGAEFGAAVGVCGSVIVAGAPMDDALTADKGAVYGFIVPSITVFGVGGYSGGFDLGTLAPGSSWGPSYFDIFNTGFEPATITGVSVSGGNAADFVVAPFTGTVLPPGERGSCLVTFTPAASGPRFTTLRIATGDIFGSVYQTTLSGTGLSASDDTDGDGLNDVAEFHLSILGFQWNFAQPNLVDSIYRNAGTAGFHQDSGVRFLRVPTPRITRDAAAGKVKLTARFEWSADSTDWQPFSASSGDVSVNGQGDIEFGFGDTDETMFFSIETE